MSWAKLDDRAHEHRKQEAAGAEACWMWACGLMYCNRQPARDGFIPETRVAKLFEFKNPKRLAAKLVEVGLWEKVDGGYRVHDFTFWNRSKEQTDADREATRNRVKKHRYEKARNKQEEEARNSTGNAVTSPDETAATTGLGNGVGTGSGSGSGSDSDAREADPDAKVPCPVPLPLDDQDFANLEIGNGIPRVVAEANLRAWAASERAAKSNPRPIAAWVKCGLKALRGQWSDSGKRAEMKALANPKTEEPKPRTEDFLTCL